MGLTALDIVVLILVGGAALLGARRGFVAEVLSMFAWVAIVAMLKLFHVALAAKRTRTSILGPVDRALGFGFGALKGLILASLAFLLAALLVDTARGGPARRPAWMTDSRCYNLLNATSAGIADFVDRRRRGLPVFGSRAMLDREASQPGNGPDNGSDPR